MTPLHIRSNYPLSVDCIIFGFIQETLQVALIQRKKPPFVGAWAIPGGFLEGDETVEEAAFRELQEETGIHDIYLEQFQVFSKPHRDPRGRVITVGLFALIAADKLVLTATEDAQQAQWYPAYQLPPLAFDHEEIYNKALEALRTAVRIKPLIFKLLPPTFTLGQLQTIYEQIFNSTFDKRNFRKKILTMDCIQATTTITKGGRHRPARLYTFNNKQYQKNKEYVPYSFM